MLPVDSERLVFPIYNPVPAWPYLLIGGVLVVMVVTLYLMPTKAAESEEVSGKHFQYLLMGIAGYLSSLFISSFYWFPPEARRVSGSISVLSVEVLLGASLFLLGVSISCYFFYLASKGNSERHPDLMRRFVLGLFSFLQFDKMPLLVTYLLIYSPETQVIFPNIAGFALASYIPVGLLLWKTTRETNLEAVRE